MAYLSTPLKSEPTVPHALDSPPTAAQNRTRMPRRVSKQILIAFHQACDEIDLEVAKGLLDILEALLNGGLLDNGGRRQDDMENLVAAHERLWHLRHYT